MPSRPVKNLPQPDQAELLAYYQRRIGDMAYLLSEVGSTWCRLFHITKEKRRVAGPPLCSLPLHDLRAAQRTLRRREQTCSGGSMLAQHSKQTCCRWIASTPNAPTRLWNYRRWAQRRLLEGAGWTVRLGVIFPWT